ncbi:hypothetical protein FQN54_006964 [Arachnomyces sp. PD_36]|nr:hypothetical protein FQN54_006964 [Arachnomyces sp. PD_36]
MPSVGLTMNSNGTPSNAQLALALAVVKFKPSNTTIKDYILGIRGHIKGGRQERDWNVPESHLESIAFWQQAYEKSESAQSQLLDRIYELERRNDALMDRLRPVGSEVTQSSFQTQTSSKRKSKGQGGGSAITGSRKRPTGTAMGVFGDQGTSTKGSAQDIVPEFEYLEPNTASFLRQLYWLQQLLQKKLNLRSLSMTAVGLCESGVKLIEWALEPKKKLSRARTTQKMVLQPAAPDIISILRGIERSYPYLLRSLKKVSAAEEGNSHAGLMVYHIILLFRTILDGLHRHSIATAEENIARAKRSDKTKGKAKTNKPTDTQVPIPPKRTEDDKIPRQLGHLLEAMVLSLDPSMQEQCNLLEGFLFVLLDRVGKTLCFFVLGDLQVNPKLRLDPSELPLPSGLSETPNDEVSQKSAEYEAKQLIGVLEKALAFTEHHKEKMATTSMYHNLPPDHLINQSERDGLGNRPTSNVPPSIAQTVRTMLQNTLLKAVFGDQDPSFENSLPSPKIPELAPPPAGQRGTEMEDTSEWFTREVWRLLGWDILSRA